MIQARLSHSLAQFFYHRSHTKALLALSATFDHTPFLLKADMKRTSAWLPLSMRILVTSHLSMWMVMTIASMCGNEARLISLAENVMGM
jgi:hypothetical protein